LWNPLYLEYLDKVVHYVDTHYATRAEPAGRIHIGTSAGARASFQVLLERSSTFGRFGMLSPALSGFPHIYEPLFTGRTKLAHTMARWFREAGVEAKTFYLHESHSFGNWRHVAGDALTYLLAP
jgi:enterochelin esterase-like enzyme